MDLSSHEGLHDCPGFSSGDSEGEDSCPSSPNVLTLKLPTKTILNVDKDPDFSFLTAMPVIRSMFEGHILIHSSDARMEEPLLFFPTTGRSYRPVCTVLTAPGENSLQERTLLAVPNQSEYPYIVAFQGAQMRSKLHADMLSLVLSTFGIFSRKRVTVLVIHSPNIAKRTPTLEFIRAWRQSFPGLDSVSYGLLEVFILLASH